jgi:hypothetical protein
MLRVIVFCDICNPQRIRYIEQQRNSERGDEGGRRITDGRSWYEGSLTEAEQIVWIMDGDKHFFPKCEARQNES